MSGEGGEESQPKLYFLKVTMERNKLISVMAIIVETKSFLKSSFTGFVYYIFPASFYVPA